MRISDDRYDRERSSLDLALKFLRHGARTQAIRSWTVCQTIASEGYSVQIAGYSTVGSGAARLMPGHPIEGIK